MSNSLRNAKNFVADAFVFAPDTPFVPENVKLGEYTFLAWVRSGLAAAADNPAGAALRATASVHVAVQGDGVASQTVDKTVTLRGPGDIISLDSTEIVRRVRERTDRLRDEVFRKHGVLDIGVPAIRELRGELPSS